MKNMVYAFNDDKSKFYLDGLLNPALDVTSFRQIKPAEIVKKSNFSGDVTINLLDIGDTTLLFFTIYASNFEFKQWTNYDLFTIPVNYLLGKTEMNSILDHVSIDNHIVDWHLDFKTGKFSIYNRNVTWNGGYLQCFAILRPGEGRIISG